MKECKRVPLAQASPGGLLSLLPLAKYFHFLNIAYLYVQRKPAVLMSGFTVITKLMQLNVKKNNSQRLLRSKNDRSKFAELKQQISQKMILYLCSTLPTCHCCVSFIVGLETSQDSTLKKHVLNLAVPGFNSRFCTFISVGNQPATQCQLSLLSFRGR